MGHKVTGAAASSFVGGRAPRAGRQRVPVTMRALVQRINRALAKEGDDEVLKVTRGDRWRGDLGDYYVVDVNRNAIRAQHVDPEKWGREMGVLADYEEVRDD